MLEITGHPPIINLDNVSWLIKAFSRSKRIDGCILQYEGEESYLSIMSTDCIFASPNECETTRTL